jgi:predicted secreted protein
MRVVGEIAHPEIKITIFHWNNRYLIKLEAGPFEQTFKIEEYDLTSEEEVKKVVSEEFIQQATARFNEMAKSLQEATKFL